MDVLVFLLMKNAAKCNNKCEMCGFVRHNDFEYLSLVHFLDKC